MAKRYDAVVAGHLCLDIIPDLSSMSGRDFRDLFLPGRLLQVGPAALSTGGAVSNTGLSLTKLGIKTRLMGKVGNDLFGRAVRGIVNNYGPHLADDMVVDETESTSYTIIVNPSGMDRIFLHCPGANASFGADDIRYDVVARARLFHFGYPPLLRKTFEDDGAQLVEMFQRVKQIGVTTSLDMAMFDPTSAAGRADWVIVLERVMPHVDLFVPNVEETLFTLRRETFDTLSRSAGESGLLSLITPQLLADLGQQVLGMGAKVVGLKLGDRGLYVRTGTRSAIEAMGAARPSNPSAWANKEVWAPCFKAKVVGTTGAGDATVAGFISALLRDMSLEQSVTAALAVGACNVEAADALSGIRPWEDTLRRVERGWLRHHLSLQAPGWRFDDHHQLWVGPTEM